MPNATYDLVGTPSLASGRILYNGQLAGDGITAANRYGIWEGPINAPELLFRAGQDAPGISDDVNFGEFGGQHLNSTGQIAFQNSLQGPGANSSDWLTLWAGSRTNPQLVLRPGLQAPGTPTGVQFAESIPFGTRSIQRSNGWDLNDQGQVIFFAFLKGPGLDVTNNSGIFAGPPGAVQLIARAGSQAPGTAPGVNFYNRPNRLSGHSQFQPSITKQSGHYCL